MMLNEREHSSLPAFYNTHSLYLWVEDLLTQRYLKTLWQTEIWIKVYIAGGKQGVKALTQHAHSDGIQKVFGLVDRDFGNSNHEQWSSTNSSLKCFYTSGHELENYLLDSQALANSMHNTCERTPEELDEKMREVATSLVGWMACCELLDILQRESKRDFPRHPTPHMQNNRDVYLRHIQESVWFTHRERFTSEWSAQKVEASFKESCDTYDAALQDGSWKQTFAGKEIFCKLCDFISKEGCDASRRPEIAQDIAAYQREQKTIPNDLQELLRALKQRVEQHKLR